MVENEKFVLFLDILGFKDLIEKNSAEEVKKIYEQQVIKTIGPSIHAASHIYGFPMSINHVVDGNTLKDSVQDIFQIHIMSDSIIIWTKDTSNENLTKFISFTSIFIAMTFSLGVPLRGAISKGYVSELITPVNNIVQSCVVGTGIVNAYQLEGKQNWMGCIVDKSCFTNIPDSVIDIMISSKLSSLAKYRVPIKKKNHKNKLVYDAETNYVVNWTNLPDILKNDIKFFEDNFSRFEKSIEHKDVKQKIKNTFDFYKIYSKKD